MKQHLRKYPHLFKFLSVVKEWIVEPFTTGFVFAYIGYLLTKRRKEKTYLKKLGLTNISVFKPRSWRYNEKCDGASRRYYTTEYKGKRYFIKVAFKDLTIDNEIEIAKYLQGFEFKYTPKCFLIDESVYKNGKILINEFIDGLYRFEIPSSKIDFEKICLSFLLILSKLKSINLIHADIHPCNLLLDNDYNLVLLDFGISIIKDKKNSVDYFARPGTFYIEQDNNRIYDDAYSFVKMMEKLKISKDYRECDAYRNIENRIGDFCETISIDSTNRNV